MRSKVVTRIQRIQLRLLRPHCLRSQLLVALYTTHRQAMPIPTYNRRLNVQRSTFNFQCYSLRLSTCSQESQQGHYITYLPFPVAMQKDAALSILSASSPGLTATLAKRVVFCLRYTKTCLAPVGLGLYDIVIDLLKPVFRHKAILQRI